MRACAMTDIGRNRLMNQDYIFCSKDPIGNLPNLFIVADGMGGHKAGDFASSFIVQNFITFVQSLAYENPISIMSEALQRANLELYKTAKDSPDLEGTGTTFVAAILKESTLYIANVGDSRLYVIGDSIRQITRDHSLVEEMVSMGEIDKRAARTHEKKNIITRAVGVNDKVMADFFEVDLSYGEMVLLCSDGLSDMVEDAEILYQLSSQEETEQKVHGLVELANRNGGRDNISVILIEPDKFEV